MDDRSDVEHSSIADLDAAPHAPVFDRDDPRVIRLTLEADESVPAHDHPDANVVIVLLTGELQVRLDGETHTLTSNEALRFDGEREVQPHAVLDSTALVVLASK